jgi:excisionase family DNA binding protein
MKQLILSPIPLEELKAAITDAVKCELQKLQLHNTDPPTEYITRKKTAEILGISLPTLNDWSKRGVIPSYRICSRVRYKREEVMNSVNKVQTIKYGRNN